MQWGTVTGGAVGWRNVSYPISFPTAVFVLVSQRLGIDKLGTPYSGESLIARKTDTNTFKIYYSGDPHPVDYIAIGI